LRRFAYSLTGNREDADDLAQAVIEKLLSRGLPEEANERKWIFRVCKNLWIDEIRSREVRRSHAKDVVNECDGTPADGMLKRLEAQRLIKALDKLPASQRLPISLVAIEGLTYAEAAEMLEVPIGTVMSRISRARNTLLRLMAE